VQHGDQLVAAIGSDALAGAEEMPFDGADGHGEPVGDLVIR
jgi:hypothetical protein